MHEEAAVAMAHGYSKAAGKPMGAMIHGSVGVQHAAMAIYNAWVDRVPVMIFAGNGLDAVKRRPGTEWNHSVQDPALLVRDFLKWDDYPMSLQHFAESAVRGYKIAMTPPMEPVLITADMDLQEDAIHDEGLKIPKLARSRPPQGDRAALAEAARWLVDAEAPVIIADRCARNQEGVKLLVALAEALQAPVTTARLAAETWNAIKAEPWSLAVSDRIPWARRLWPATEYHHMLGGSGAQGVGYAAPAALGVALANKSKGLFTVTFQPDGDLMYSPGILWTAAYPKIPVLFVMHNNRAYHPEVMHRQRMAALHKRRLDTAWVGTIIDNPAIDYAKLAQAQGVWAEGPIEDPAKLGAALKRAVAVVRSGAPALVDVVCQGR